MKDYTIIVGNLLDIKTCYLHTYLFPLRKDFVFRSSMILMPPGIPPPALSSYITIHPTALTLMSGRVQETKEEAPTRTGVALLAAATFLSGKSIASTQMHQVMNLLQTLFYFCFVTSVSSFCPPQPQSGRLHSVSLHLVTEKDVIELVEKAEELWAKVESLRNEARELSTQAESLGQEAETSAADAIDSLKESISETKIVEANKAQNSCIDLGSLLEKAMEATKEADEIEVLAEEALASSEKALEQHLIDFPEDDEINVM